LPRPAVEGKPRGLDPSPLDRLLDDDVSYPGGLSLNAPATRTLRSELGWIQRPIERNPLARHELQQAGKSRVLTGVGIEHDRQQRRGSRAGEIVDDQEGRLVITGIRTPADELVGDAVSVDVEEGQIAAAFVDLLPGFPRGTEDQDAPKCRLPLRFPRILHASLSDAAAAGSTLPSQEHDRSRLSGREPQRQDLAEVVSIGLGVFLVKNAGSERSDRCLEDPRILKPN
jgi:hypothetical protein